MHGSLVYLLYFSIVCVCGVLWVALCPVEDFSAINGMVNIISRHTSVLYVVDTRGRGTVSIFVEITLSFVT